MLGFCVTSIYSTYAYVQQNKIVGGLCAFALVDMLMYLHVCVSGCGEGYREAACVCIISG